MPYGFPSQAQVGLGAAFQGLAGGLGQAMAQQDAARRQQAYMQALMGQRMQKEQMLREQQDRMIEARRQMDAERFQRSKELETLKGQNKGQSMRGTAAMMNAMIPTSAKERLTGLENYIPLHNQIVDAIVAIQRKNPNAAKAVISSWAAKNPDVSGLLQTKNLDSQSAASIYDNLTRLAAIEQYRLQLGSRAKPTEKEVKENQQMYPNVAEIMNNSPAVRSRLNAITETIVTPAIRGASSNLGLMKMNGKFLSPEIEGVYNELQKRGTDLKSRLRYLPGSNVGESGAMGVPGLNDISSSYQDTLGNTPTAPKTGGLMERFLSNPAQKVKGPKITKDEATGIISID